MADDKRVSRNAPCPCGSGKKFKNCCLGKGSQAQARPARRNLLLPAVRPRQPAAAAAAASPPPPLAIPTLYSAIDGRLKQAASGHPGEAAWKGAVLRLSDSTPAEERLGVYRLVREAAVLPDEAAGFLFGHAAQWIVPEGIGAEEEGDDDEGDDRAFAEAMGRHEQDLLRRHGQADLAGLMASDRLAYDRRFERGRQYFYGPPDEDLAVRLRQEGVID